MLTCCAKCGDTYEKDHGQATCPSCRPRDRARTRRATRGGRNELGYDYQWQKLSERARKLQPFCSECGSPDDLTVDHTPEAWRRKEAGKLIRLEDVEVLCRSHNSSAGAARGPNVRPDAPIRLPES